MKNIQLKHSLNRPELLEIRHSFCLLFSDSLLREHTLMDPGHKSVIVILRLKMSVRREPLTPSGQ